ncbi:MAG: SdrD B-like domain-containing protein [Chloroflexota bacterium]
MNNQFTNTTKLAAVAILFILIQVLSTTVCFASNADNNTGDNAVATISGTVWNDENGNQIHELMEATMAGVTVSIKNLNTHDIITTQTDEYGNFIMSGLAYGLYMVSCDDGNATTDSRVVELSEVNGTGILNFGINTGETNMEAADVEMMLLTSPAPTVVDQPVVLDQVVFNIFLPVVNN